MKTIITKYHGPGNIRGSRMTATDNDGHTVRIPHECEWSHDEAHDEAARALCRRMGWTGKLARGETKIGGRLVGVYVFLRESEVLDLEAAS